MRQSLAAALRTKIYTILPCILQNGKRSQNLEMKPKSQEVIAPSCKIYAKLLRENTPLVGLELVMFIVKCSYPSIKTQNTKFC